jgi:hypothetical protein
LEGLKWCFFYGQSMENGGFNGNIHDLTHKMNGQSNYMLGFHGKIIQFLGYIGICPQ